MRSGIPAFIATILVLLGCLAAACIDATTVFTVPDPGSMGDDGGGSGDDGSSESSPASDGAGSDVAPDDAPDGGGTLEGAVSDSGSE